MASNKIVTLDDLHVLLLNLNAKVDLTQTTLTEFKQELMNVGNRTNNLEKENIALKVKVFELDHKLRNNSIVVFGLENQLNCVDALTFLSSKLEINLGLQDFNFINLFTSKNNKKILKIDFLYNLKKSQVLKNLNKLKDSHIFVAEDLNPQDQLLHKELRKHLNTGKKNGLKIFIKNNRLCVNNKKYTLEELNTNPDILASLSIISRPPTSEGLTQSSSSSGPSSNPQDLDKITDRLRNKDKRQLQRK
ncbi:unnamed protein product [Psylliodes chrysocephalus]|uniref:Uncharacterized protein n=1 Tax=Psylliodes chrysocephalus TaxID=3402493 RepID=A0A9P0CYR4_9CUCU|nr:unnamed protein product [Psylliodes chrysocephala]